MSTKTEYELSQFLSLILRHNPEKINLKLDKYGYLSIEEIIVKSKDIGVDISENEIKNVVSKSDKQRFKIIGNKIKANQGHSIEISLEELSQKPPNILYHGTKFKLKATIHQLGLLRMQRNFVHMYQDYYRSFVTGNRTAKKSLVFEIDAEQMYLDGFEFYESDNHVWQTKFVPSKYLNIKELSEVDFLKKVIVTKTTYFSKTLAEIFILEQNFNSQASIYVNNCYICKCNRSLYTFSKNKVICEELSYERPRKRHVLIGRTLNFEHFQNEDEIILQQTFEINIKDGYELLIEKDVKFQAIQLSFNCPHCNQKDSISNITEVGTEYKCKKCNTDLLEIKRLTEITQHVNNNPL